MLNSAATEQMVRAKEWPTSLKCPADCSIVSDLYKTINRYFLALEVLYLQTTLQW